MKIEILPLGQLQTNCYIARCGGEAVIIDPADEAEFIAEKSSGSISNCRRFWRLTAILTMFLRPANCK